MNEIPDIHIEYDDTHNPTIKSPNCLYELQFYQTKESLMDIEVYKRFLENAISRFRHSLTYKHYKGYLIDEIGLNRCQLFGNIDIDTVGGAKGIEMHHNFLTIFDIALMITEHVINTTGYISTFDLVQLLKEEHKANRIPIVMLSKTAHQMFHANDTMVLPAKMCFGYWTELIAKYNKGITIEIAQKIINFIKVSLEDDGNLLSDYSQNLLKLRDNIIDWSNYNEYGTSMVIKGYYQI